MSSNAVLTDEEAKKKRTRNIIIAVVGFVVLLGIISLIVFFTRSRNNRLPSSYFNWTSQPDQDTPRLLELGQKVALFHILSGRYIRTDQTQKLTASASEAANDNWAQFWVRPGHDEYPGSVRLQNVEIAKLNPESGFIRFGVDVGKGTFDINAQGSTGNYTALFAYPPSDEATQTAVAEAREAKKKVLKMSNKNIPITLTSPRALNVGSQIYPFLAMNVDGDIVTDLTKDATRDSVQSQLLLVRL